ncbi:MAG TPA: hypothetical protein VGI63_01390 [Verrucomicrobiae bacterium]
MCGQHMMCDTSHGGSVMDCPTCFQKIVAPGAPAPDTKLILTGQKYVEKPTAASLDAINQSRQRPKNGGAGGRVFIVIGGLAVLGAGFFAVHMLSSGGTPVPLANAGFETPVTDDYVYAPGGGAWTFTPKNGGNGSGIAANNKAFTSGNPPAPEGSQVAFLQAHGVISQVVSGFAPGQHYTMTFAAAQRANFPQRGQTWDLQINGKTIKSFAPAQAANQYAIYSAGFVATAAVNTVAFVGTDLAGGDNTVFIDNAQITRP